MDFEQIRNSKQFTPEWFANRYPGFYSPECYDILANYFNRQDPQETKEETCGSKMKIRMEENELAEEGVEENKENVPPTELVGVHSEHSGELQG
jgi:hypothetical protein